MNNKDTPAALPPIDAESANANAPTGNANGSGLAATPTATNPSFINPYRGLSRTDEALRLSLDAARADVQRIRSVTMDWGTMQVSMGLLVRHLYSIAKDNNLTLTDREQFINYIVNLTSSKGSDTIYSVLANHSLHDVVIASGFVGTRPHDNDGSGVRHMGESDKRPQDKPTARSGKQTTKKNVKASK